MGIVASGHHSAIKEIQKALGLEDQMVKRLVIEIEAGKAIVITATIFMQVPGVNGLAAVIRKYEIKELKPEVPDYIGGPIGEDASVANKINFKEFLG